MEDKDRRTDAAQHLPAGQLADLPNSDHGQRVDTWARAATMILGLILAVFLGLIPAAIAQGKGHSFGAWWIFGALLFIVALPMALMLTPDSAQLEARDLARGGRKCPHCAEVIKAEAVVCRYCGRDIAPRQAAIAATGPIVPRTPATS